MRRTVKSIISKPEELEKDVLAHHALRHEYESEDGVEQPQMRVLFVRPSEVLHLGLLSLFLDPVHEIVDSLLIFVLHHFDSEHVMHLVHAVSHNSALYSLRLSGQIDCLNLDRDDSVFSFQRVSVSAPAQ